MGEKGGTGGKSVRQHGGAENIERFGGYALWYNKKTRRSSKHPRGLRAALTN